VNAAGTRVLADDFSNSLRQIRVPGRRHSDAAEGSGCTIVADANRPIRHLQAGEMNVWDFADVKIVYATDQVYLFFQRKLLEQRVSASVDLRRNRLRRLAQGGKNEK